MLPFTIEQMVPYVVAVLTLIGVWVSARTRKRGDAESNVMDRLESMIERGDKLLKDADDKIKTLTGEVETLKEDRDRQNRNIGVLTTFARQMTAYVQKHLPERSDAPQLPDLED